MLREIISFSIFALTTPQSEILMNTPVFSSLEDVHLPAHIESENTQAMANRPESIISLYYKKEKEVLDNDNQNALSHLDFLLIAKELNKSEYFREASNLEILAFEEAYKKSTSQEPLFDWMA
jgi:hypothetical protein